MADKNTTKETLLVGGVGLVSLATLFQNEYLRFGVIIAGLALIGLRGYLKSRWQEQRDAEAKAKAKKPARSQQPAQPAQPPQ